MQGVEDIKAAVPPKVLAKAAPEAIAPYGSWPFVERRSGIDRRARSKDVRSLKLLGRRARGRRRADHKNLYVERFDADDLGLALGILGLNIADAWLTLSYLQVGGSEANPIAQEMLDLGTGWFAAGKALLIAFCVIVLTLHKNFTGVRTALRLLFAFYWILLHYHGWLAVASQAGS